MTDQLVRQSFDYSQLPEDISRQLKESAIIIQQSMKRTCHEIIITGTELLKAKGLVQHGQFENWCQAEFKLSKQMAHNFMNAAKVYGKSKIVLLFKPTILYELAAPSTPETVRTEVEQKIQQGESVTVRQIKDLKSQLQQKETRIKELSKTADRTDQFYKQTIAEIEQQNQQTLKRYSIENDHLRKQVNELESQLLSAEPDQDPEPPQLPGDNGQYRQQVINLECVVADLNQEIVSLRESKASENINLMRRLKSEYETKEQEYQSTIEQLQQDIADLKSGVFPDEEIHYEPDDADTGIASFLSFLDRLDSSSNYDSQLVAQLEDIRNRIEVYLDRMQVDVF